MAMSYYLTKKEFEKIKREKLNDKNSVFNYKGYTNEDWAKMRRSIENLRNNTGMI